MATEIYKSGYVNLVDGTEIYITPLKIKHLRQFLNVFDLMKDSTNDDESLSILTKCVAIAMRQFYPLIKTAEDVEDNFDLQSIYDVLKYCAGIEFTKTEKTDEDENEVKNSIKEPEDSSWNTLDLAKLESEVFLLGIWKDYEDLESCLSMPELTAILNQKRESDYNEKKFLAAMQGVDLDKQSGQKNEWEEMRDRILGGGDPQNDIANLRGINAERAGFGIGMGLEYEDLG